MLNAPTLTIKKKLRTLSSAKGLSYPLAIASASDKRFVRHLSSRPRLSSSNKSAAHTLSSRLRGNYGGSGSAQKLTRRRLAPSISSTSRSSPRALALGLLVSQRNMGLMVAATPGVLPGLTWLYFALSQFPIYLSPQLLKPIVGRLDADDAKGEG